VPRDFVFGKFASVGGVKETWIAPLYILTANFADDLPADEDQMPPDGNPHPLPGDLLPNHHNFVGPQYPEIGWDALPEPDVPVNQQHDDNIEDNMNMEEVENVQESMILNPSDASGSSVNMEIDGNNVVAPD
jgi:hypothetical protein